MPPLSRGLETEGATAVVLGSSLELSRIKTSSRISKKEKTRCLKHTKEKEQTHQLSLASLPAHKSKPWNMWGVLPATKCLLGATASIWGMYTRQIPLTGRGRENVSIVTNVFSLQSAEHWTPSSLEKQNKSQRRISGGKTARGLDVQNMCLSHFYSVWYDYCSLLAWCVCS